MIFLPKNLSCLARLCAGNDGRYAMTGPKVYEYADGFYRVVASDGYRLAAVAGQGGEPTEHPSAALDAAPNGVFESVVPSRDWTEAFKMCGKYPNGDDEPLGMVMGEQPRHLRHPQGHAVGRARRGPLSRLDADPAAPRRPS